MQDSHYQINRPLCLLTAVYLLWLLAVLLIFGHTPTNDGVGYRELAEYCLEQHQPYPTTAIYQQSPFVWNIGIINITELSLWLTGSIWPVLIVMCLLKSVTALMTGLITRHFFGQRIAVVAMLLFMLYPNNWGQSTMISSEIPSTCLTMTAVWLAIGRRQFFPAGLLLALANWFRPTAAVFFVTIVIYLMLFQRERLFRNIGKLIAGTALFIVVVGTSCYLRTGHFVYQSRSYWFSMVDECYDGAEVAPHWGQPVWPEGTPRYIENHEQMDCFDFERIWRQRSIQWLKEHPADYLGKIPGRLYYMYQNDYDNMTAFLSDKSRPENNCITIPFRRLGAAVSTLTVAQWLALVCLLCYAALLVVACIATVRLIRKRQFESLFFPLFVIVGGSLLLVTVMHGETRFKDPFMPFFFILAANLKPATT